MHRPSHWSPPTHHERQEIEVRRSSSLQRMMAVLMAKVHCLQEHRSAINTRQPQFSLQVLHRSHMLQIVCYNLLTTSRTQEISRSTFHDIFPGTTVAFLLPGQSCSVRAWLPYHAIGASEVMLSQSSNTYYLASRHQIFFSPPHSAR